MLNNNTINLGCLPNSSFSFSGDRESENWFAIHSDMCVAPQRIDLGINKREILVEKITPAFHHKSKHRIIKPFLSKRQNKNTLCYGGEKLATETKGVVQGHSVTAFL